jgi:DNA polymerase-1
MLGIPSLSLDGYEADDLIGTVATEARTNGWEVVIVTGDRDALQLVQPGISVLAFKKGVTDTIVFDEAEVRAQYGLTPAQFLEYKIMRGDPSDNIPGIRGIGEKGATELLQTYGDLAGVYRAVHDATSALKPAMREKLSVAEQELPALRKLVTIVTDVPIGYTPKPGMIGIQDEAAFKEYLLTFGFKTLVARVPVLLGKAPEPVMKRMKPSAKASVEERPDRPLPLTKDEELKETHVTTEVALLKVLEAWNSASQAVIHTVPAPKDSLFAGKVDGFVVVLEGQLFHVSAKALASAKAVAAVQAWLDSPSVRRVAHDAKAIMLALETFNLAARVWDFDTMLAAYLLAAGERSHDLPSVVARFLGHPIAEDASASVQAKAIWRVSVLLRAALSQERLTTVLTRFELPLVPILRDMERLGIRIDADYLKQLAADMQQEKSALEKKMLAAAGREFNPASPSQLAEVLFTDLKLPTKGIKKGKTGFSTAASELEKLHGLHPLIGMIEEQRELAKLLSTYVEVLPALADGKGRIHTTYNQAVAATGRLSSTDPNLQNIPIRTEVGRKIRRAFVADPGYRLLSCDYSQVELRIVAALAKDERMLEAFRQGADIHTATAASIWHIPKDEVTKDQRRIAKAINFGLIFGQGPQGLSVAAGITFAEAKMFIAAYFDAYKGIKRYMEETKALAHKLGYVETFFGRRRQLPEIHSTLHQLRAQAERMAINMPVQGTDADLMKLAMIELAKTLPAFSPETRMLLQVHDELLFEVPDAQVERVAKFVQQTMEQVEEIGVPIVVEAKVGQNWEEMQKL